MEESVFMIGIWEDGTEVVMWKIVALGWGVQMVSLADVETDALMR